MDFSKTSIVQMMNIKMNYHAERQDVLAQNIANADTPGFRPKDLAPLDFESMAFPRKRLEMVRTSPAHSEGMSLHAPDHQANEARRNFEIKPVKNAVNLEEQMSMVSHNAFAYQMSNTLYRKTADLFRLSVQNR